MNSSHTAIGIVQTAKRALTSDQADWSDVDRLMAFRELEAGVNALFRHLRDAPRDEDLVRGCACAVYGWMPRILSHVDVRAGVSILVDGLQGQSQPFVNRSWVGTSKFLYFFDSRRYAIWDSRVRRTLSKGTNFNVKCAAEYNVYCSAIVELANDKELVETVRRRFPKGDAITPTRLVESALYVIGKKH